MIAFTIDKVANVSPIIADAIRISELIGNRFKSARLASDGWAITFTGHMSKVDIQRFLFDSDKCVTSNSTLSNYDVDTNSDIKASETVIYLDV